jgi:hypothetical protein
MSRSMPDGKNIPSCPIAQWDQAFTLKPFPHPTKRLEEIAVKTTDLFPSNCCRDSATTFAELTFIPVTSLAYQGYWKRTPCESVTSI